jgi:glucosamine--fructose-6-phosphate aminotransferase (isomerizing)
MCGIVGYVGPRPALDVIVEGLRRLEYRGYDSAGVAIIGGGQLQIAKKAGRIENLDKELSTSSITGSTGMGHTRWATHGPPNDRNAHPHTDASGRIAVVHNGIIENFAQLRDELERVGVELVSETDTEVVAHLVAGQLDAQGGSLVDAVRVVCRRLRGAFTLVLVDAQQPEVVVAARRNSPLVLGVGDGETFLGSDVAAFIEYTREAVELGQDQIVEIRRDGYTITGFDGARVEGRPFHIDWDLAAAEKGGYDYFMLKEIAEQPDAVAATLLGRFAENGTLQLDETSLDPVILRDIDKIVIVACGSAFNAGLIAKYAVEHWAGLPCEVELASEFRYRDPILDRRSLVIAISQSGETLDTLMAVQHAQTMGARVLAICNTNGSTIPREADAVLYTRAGPEVGVAATKSFTTQLVAVYLVALYLGQVRGTKFGDEVDAVVRELAKMHDQVAKVLNTMEPVREIARELADVKTVLFLGRHVGFPVALEGALKLKELAYMHAEGFAAGELKHGPIALIEDGVPVVVMMPSPCGRAELHRKMLSNIQEVRARGARILVIAEEGDEAVVPYADWVVHVPVVPTLLQPLVSVIPLQVFACELAVARGNNVDRPRNLAKSVTVE